MIRCVTIYAVELTSAASRAKWEGKLPEVTSYSKYSANSCIAIMNRQTGALAVVRFDIGSDVVLHCKASRQDVSIC